MLPVIATVGQTLPSEADRSGTHYCISDTTTSITRDAIRSY